MTFVSVIGNVKLRMLKSTQFASEATCVSQVWRLQYVFNCGPVDDSGCAQYSVMLNVHGMMMII